MYAITIAQPWAWLIVHRHQLVINGCVDLRERIAIHAAKSDRDLGFCDEARELVPELPPAGELPRGAVVGSVKPEVTEHVDHYRRGNPSPGVYAVGPVVTAVAWPWALPEPIAWRGKPDLWLLPDWIMRKVANPETYKPKG